MVNIKIQEKWILFSGLRGYFPDMEQGIGLGASARVRRGFNRAGALVAALTLLVGAFYGFLAVTSAWSAEEDRYKEAICYTPTLKAIRDEGAKGGFNPNTYRVFNEGCGYYLRNATVSDVQAVLDGWPASRYSAVATAIGWAVLASVIAALSLWALIAGVGWAFSGFFRD